MSERVGVVIQARISSGRLPGKALADVAGKPLLRRLYDRMKTCRRADAVVVATSDRPADDEVARACADWGAPVYRGPEQDLTTRLLGAARSIDVSAIVRVTGDNPLTDPGGVDELIETFRRTGDPVVHNHHRLGYPYGTGTELMAVAAIEACDGELVGPAERELFATHVRQHPERFPCTKVAAPPELYRPELFLTVDYAEDLALVNRVFAHFGGRDDVPLRDIVAWLDRQPDIAAINRHLHTPFPD
ncbi:MAG TPA: NTP transferase domain-containing protein [Gemmataceae bacterium]|jgi:spore coat polysaccharide biosynthesis protein SpsF|nr:NTP transferase domain-containing protein [Gemmataceae bacterium]